MLNHNKLCGILYPECLRIELLPDLVFVVGFFRCSDCMCTNPLSRVPWQSQIVRAARIL